MESSLPATSKGNLTCRKAEEVNCTLEKKIIIAKDKYSTDLQTGFYHLDKSMQQILDEVNKLLSDGWFLDGSAYASSGRGQPMRVEGVGVVYHLVKYTDKELEEIEEQMKQQEAEANDPLAKLGAKILDAQQVPWGIQVQCLLKEGYRIVDKWKDCALLYLYEGEEIKKTTDQEKSEKEVKKEND